MYLLLYGSFYRFLGSYFGVLSFFACISYYMGVSVDFGGPIFGSFLFSCMYFLPYGSFYRFSGSCLGVLSFF